MLKRIPEKLGVKSGKKNLKKKKINSVVDVPLRTVKEHREGKPQVVKEKGTRNFQGGRRKVGEQEKEGIQKRLNSEVDEKGE